MENLRVIISSERLPQQWQRSNRLDLRGFREVRGAS